MSEQVKVKLARMPYQSKLYKERQKVWQEIDVAKEFADKHGLETKETE